MALHNPVQIRRIPRIGRRRTGPPIHIREAMARLTKARKLLLDDSSEWLSVTYRGENLGACYQEDLRRTAYWFIDRCAIGER
jgi:hypothetical protein